MEQKQLKDLKKGEFFRLVESETATVWVKGQRISRKGIKTKYECHQYEDVNHFTNFRADRAVFVGFTY